MTEVISGIPDGVLLLAAAWLCLTAGSFINVVAYRLPIMMAAGDEEPALTLSTPSSHCPQCSARIPAWLNIPVIGYVLAMGRCRSCKAPIPISYPAVEVIVGAVGVTILLVNDLSLAGVHALACFLGLAAAAAVDHQAKLLPSAILYPVIAIALLGAAAGVSITSPEAAIFGAATGLSICFIADNAYGYFTGRQGLADGDWRLCATIGAVVGPLHLLTAMFIACLAAFGYKLVSRYRTINQFPFGPPLVFGATVVIVYDPTPLINFLLVRA